MYIYIFQILFHYRLLQGIEYSSLFYTVTPDSFKQVVPRLETMMVP